jgi:hypothetical protein
MSDEEHLRGVEGGPEQEGVREGYEWEGEPDLTSISEEEPRVRLKELAEEERAVSYRRRVPQGRIDLIRVQLVRRGGVALSPEELARILMGGEDASLGRSGGGGV